MVGDRLYVVLEGKIKLTRAAPDGRENLLSVLGPGEMFGELSLFDPRPRTSSAVALTDTRLAALAHDELLDWLTGRPEVYLHLLRALAQRLRRANDVMADLVFTDVPGRVAKALLDLADRFGEQTAEGLQVHHDLTQEELAQLVGASRETVNKALADFAARGWLTLSAEVRADHRRGAAGQARPLRSGAGPPGAVRPGWPGSRAGPAPTTGRRATGTVHVGVDAGDDLLAGPVPGGQRGADLGEPLPAVRDVEVEHPGRVSEDRAVTRQQRAQPLLVGERPQAVQGGQVVGQAAVPGDDGGTPAQHGVPGEQGAIRRQEQADRVGGVPGGGDHAQLTACLGDHVPGRQAAVAGSRFRPGRPHRAAYQRGIRGQHRRPGQPASRAAPAEWSWCPWVSRMRLIR